MRVARALVFCNSVFVRSPLSATKPDSPLDSRRPLAC